MGYAETRFFLPICHLSFQPYVDWPRQAKFEERSVAGVMGLEPTTFRVTGGRSNQLSYTPQLLVVYIKMGLRDRVKVAPRVGLEPTT